MYHSGFAWNPPSSALSALRQCLLYAIWYFCINSYTLWMQSSTCKLIWRYNPLERYMSVITLVAISIVTWTCIKARTVNQTNLSWKSDNDNIFIIPCTCRRYRTLGPTLNWINEPHMFFFNIFKYVWLFFTV